MPISTFTPGSLQYYADPRNPFMDYQYADIPVWERERMMQDAQKRELRKYADSMGMSNYLKPEPVKELPKIEPKEPAKPKINKKLLLLS